jgi:hypothetical protein
METPTSLKEISDIDTLMEKRQLLYEQKRKEMKKVTIVAFIAFLVLLGIGYVVVQLYVFPNITSVYQQVIPPSSK